MPCISAHLRIFIAVLGLDMSKRCLIIGDGNFSFSLAFTTKHSHHEWNVVATSLESEEEIKTRFGAEQNVNALRRFSNALVLNGIDGTRLEHYPSFNSMSFQRIIFNFPHCGGKSDIRRNRSLLENFFISSSKIIEPTKGEIWVTLCKGQGGTNMDDLHRGYENSWKIVEQAAKSGLMLSEVRPFVASDWAGYSGTGYRGTSKGFLLEGALTHVFTRSCIDRTVWKRNCDPLIVNGCQSCGFPSEVMIQDTPEVLQGYDWQEYPLLEQKWHPVSQTRDALVSILHSKFTIMESNVSYLVHKLNSRCLSAVCPREWLVGVDIVKKEESEDFPCVLEPSLEQRLLGLVSSLKGEKGCCMLVSGPCVRVMKPPTTISINSYQPIVSHQLMCVADTSTFSIENLGKLCTETLCRFLPVSEDCIKVSNSNSEPMCIPSTAAANTTDSGYDKVCNGMLFKLSEQLVASISEHRLSSSKPPASCHAIESTGSDNYFCLTFYLDSIALIRYEIPDARILWSKDKRFYEQYALDRTIRPFKPFCLSPPSYVHDISFWVMSSKGDSQLQQQNVEMKLSLLIGEKCGMTVVSLKNIDVYTPAVSSRVDSNYCKVGFCYRLVYSSCDWPLSPTECHLMQDDLRSSITSVPQWELR